MLAALVAVAIATPITTTTTTITETMTMTKPIEKSATKAVNESSQVNPYQGVICNNPLNYTYVFNDMVDGDQKLVSYSHEAKTVTIKPYNNIEDWVVTAPWNPTYCNATVDFNVPGKPNPPKTNLTLTYYEGFGGATVPQTFLIQFTDPSGQSPTTPLNVWVLTRAFE